ncbi:MAG TPA: hypothetical protein PKK06_05265 [Phycisphaerae bacterium]|nr:hypothetical protein [Phycisphaerae bacterium]HNU44834.1 hypothetical protein [Phycisphaerae bacterium]
MTYCDEQYDRVCKGEFAAIHAKLDRLDEAIRGNGSTGIKVRLDRLEATERVRSKLLWIIAGSTVTLAVGAVWNLIFGA